MINFTELDLKYGDKGGFVGIRKKSNNAKDASDYEFCLPFGFDEFPSDDYSAVRDLFFKMYRVFKRFENENKPIGRLSERSDRRQSDEDQTLVSEGGLELNPKEGETAVIYSKIRSIEEILDAFDDLRIRSVQQKNKTKSEVDYSKIHEYLEKSIFLSNGAIFVQSMDLPSNVIKSSVTKIVGMYCFILHEIMLQLDYDVRDEILRSAKKIEDISNRFRNAFLTQSHSLFSKENYTETKSILKQILEDIYRETPYKDYDFWNIFDALEAFLYGQLDPGQSSGGFWGIKGFGHVWEDICHTHFLRPHENPPIEPNTSVDDVGICFADTDVSLDNYVNPDRSEENQNRIGNHRTHDGSKPWHPWLFRSTTIRTGIDGSLEKCGWDEVFSVEIETTDRYPLRRFPRPDLVMGLPDGGFKIVDFKSVNEDYFEKEQDYHDDLAKQLTYEYSLQQSHDVEENIFIIPKYIPDESVEVDVINDKPVKGIDIVELNFHKALESYLPSNQ